MRIKHVPYLLFFAIGVTGCSTNGQMSDVVPFIDVRKTYPEKEINITDFAEVSYIHFNTDDDAYLYKGSICCATKNTFVVYDRSSHSVLFFSRDGVPKSRFNRFGQGPEEHLILDRILYDEETDDVFLCNENIFESNNIFIQVYSSTGEYKRKIPLPPNAMSWSLVSFDNKSLFVFAEDFHSTLISPSKRKNREIDIPYTTYYRISKFNGEILDSLKLISNEVALEIPVISLGAAWITRYYRHVKSADGFYLCNPETDTVFYYSGDRSLTPVFHKIPLVRDQDPKVVITNVVDAGKYLFFEVQTLVLPPPQKYYFLDKETGGIFRQKLILPDFKGKDFNIEAGSNILNSEDINGYIFRLGLSELKEAYDENSLSGKLKEMVASLDEYKDNDVFMFVRF